MKYEEALKITGAINEISSFLAAHKEDDPIGTPLDIMVHFPNRVTALTLLHCFNKFEALLKALRHAEQRLNDIPHNYAETDFKLIREARQAAGEVEV